MKTRRLTTQPSKTSGKGQQTVRISHQQKITPDKLMITFGDKTTTVTNTLKKQVARKTLARRTTEPRGTLKKFWNIIPDGTITNSSPTTIRLDTLNRKNTVIRKNDIAIVNESKPRLMHFVACKTVRDYNRGQEKNEFLFTEKRKNKQAQYKQPPADSNPGPSTQLDQPGPSTNTQRLRPTKNTRP